MKWMQWGPDDLRSADVEHVEEAIKLILEEQEEFEQHRLRSNR